MARRLTTSGRIPSALQPLINRLTNWQRTKWANAGYPIEPHRVEFFLGLRKHDSVP